MSGHNIGVLYNSWRRLDAQLSVNLEAARRLGLGYFGPTPAPGCTPEILLFLIIISVRGRT